MSGQIDFSRLLDDALREEREDDDHEPRKIGVYYASDLGAECMRQLYLRYIYPDKQPSIERLRIFNLGKIIHKKYGEALKEILRDEGHKARLEVNASPYKTRDFEIHGRADMVVDKEFVVEFKSVAPNALIYGDLPYKHHAAQLNFYTNQFDFKAGTILYINKITGKPHPYAVARNDIMFDADIAVISFLHEWLVDKKLPKKMDAYPERYPCTYCDLIQECGAEK